jgi:hypothetical protein
MTPYNAVIENKAGVKIPVVVAAILLCGCITEPAPVSCPEFQKDSAAIGGSVGDSLAHLECR